MDALAAGLTRTGGDYQVSRADPPSLHRRCGLDCEQCHQKRFGETAAKLGEYVEEPTKLRGAIDLDRADPGQLAVSRTPPPTTPVLRPADARG